MQVSSDASTIQTQPSVWHRPTTIAAVGEAVRQAASRNAQCHVSGSNSMPLADFDARPVETISILRMKKLVEHAVSDMVVIAEAGLSLEALQRQLAWQNQWLPVDPPAINGRQPMHRTLGGLLAANSLGPLRFGFGDYRRLLLGCRWVDARGTALKGGGRTVKNVAGYNTPRMLIGSGGTLGILAEVTLRTYARPADEQALLFFFDAPAAAQAMLRETLLAPIGPGYVQVIGGGGFANNALGLPVSKLVVVIGFLDEPALCARQVEMTRALPAAADVDSICLPAAQAGRLRLWMTSEPACAICFRVYTSTTSVAATITALEEIGVKSSGACFLVAEAGQGIVRGGWAGDEVRKVDFVRRIKRLTDGTDSRLVVLETASQDADGRPASRDETQEDGGSQDSPGANAPGPAAGPYDRLKMVLDPENTFGRLRMNRS